MPIYVVWLFEFEYWNLFGQCLIIYALSNASGALNHMVQGEAHWVLYLVSWLLTLT
jgi:hypothetical protein